MGYLVQHFINGKLVANAGERLDIYNPAQGKVVGQVCVADHASVLAAVAAAKASFPAWAATSALKRARILFRFKALLEDNLELLAQLISAEHGKTLADAKGSVQRGIDVVEFACGLPSHLQGTYSDAVASGLDTYSFRQPLGVCVGITPFNFPAMIALWMFPIAVGCGNTFIWKPSEKDPSCSLKLAQLAQIAGLPDGVLNVVQGDKTTVDLLLKDPDVKAVSFVGSTAVAEEVQRVAVAHGKRVQAFGGAKNHAVIMPDADLPQTAQAIVGAAFGSAGERCMAISVAVVVGEETANALVPLLAAGIRGLNIGPGDANNIDMGPVITKPHQEKIQQYIDIGIAEGAQLVVNGRDCQLPASSCGFYLGGTLFDYVTSTMRIYRDEIFGPVLCVVRVNTLQEAIALVSAHEYGNGTAIFTRDGYAAKTYARDVQAGMVGINIPIPVPVATHSFGGWKRSSFADIHMHGPEGVLFYTRLKTVTERWLAEEVTTHFNMPTH